MAAQSKTAALQHTVPEVQKLRNAVELMDCLSQSGFSEISSIARRRWDAQRDAQRAHRETEEE